MDAGLSNLNGGTEHPDPKYTAPASATTGDAPFWHRDFSALTGWREQSVPAWSSNSTGTTAGATGQARCIIDTPESPGLASVYAPANDVDAVSSAFLQLVEFQGRNQFSKPAPELLRVLLNNGCLAPDELLGVIDWERLRNLAEKSLGRAFTPLVPFSRIDHSDGGAEPLSRFPWDDVLSVPWTISSSLLTPGPSTLVDPAAHSSEPGAHPSAEHEQSFSNTSHAGYSPGISRRRCSNCGADLVLPRLATRARQVDFKLPTWTELSRVVQRLRGDSQVSGKST
ncbi:hypothetical protein C8R45DRAFT_1102226 [Mycena sanguinolenta]|nr:hypothetical protein C8R45DRAFT_1102226 [Mycena sanguinolenta]